MTRLEAFARFNAQVLGAPPTPDERTPPPPSPSSSPVMEPGTGRIGDWWDEPTVEKCKRCLGNPNNCSCEAQELKR